MKTLFLLSLFLFALTSIHFAQGRKVDSIYTAITESKCKKLKPQGDGVIYRAECEGVGGYKIISLGSDHRQAIDLLTPKKKTLAIDLWSNFSAAPASLGENIEWRVTGKGKAVIPFAIIVRVNLRSDPNNENKIESSLFVIKIESAAACVTDIVAPDMANQNIKARELADASKTVPCKA
jgi:hypothetical protein